MKYKVSACLIFIFMSFLQIYGLEDEKIKSSLILPLKTEKFNSVSFMQPIEKISLQKFHDKYIFRVKFFNGIKFAPRIHTLANGAKILLSFDHKVKLPPNKLLKHPIIKGYFFERFGGSSLLMVIAFLENVIFLDKKYTEDSVILSFKKNPKKLIIIDAGHGGADSGAKCLSDDFEKNLALIIAIKLRNELINSGRYRVFLTRDKDEFLSLENRIASVPEDADLLISLHANSNSDPNMRGMAIFTLPSFSGLKNLSNVEGFYNFSDGIKKYNQDLNESLRFAKILSGYIPNICKEKRDPYKRSELKILKIGRPAVLIELGYVSNKIDNELLHLNDFREKAINAILYALDKFFEKGHK